MIHISLLTQLCYIVFCSYLFGAIFFWTQAETRNSRKYYRLNLRRFNQSFKSRLKLGVTVINSYIVIFICISWKCLMICKKKSQNYLFYESASLNDAIILMHLSSQLSKSGVDDSFPECREFLFLKYIFLKHIVSQ